MWWILSEVNAIYINMLVSGYRSCRLERSRTPARFQQLLVEIVELMLLGNVIQAMAMLMLMLILLMMMMMMMMMIIIMMIMMMLFMIFHDGDRGTRHHQAWHSSYSPSPHPTQLQSQDHRFEMRPHHPPSTCSCEVGEACKVKKKCPVDENRWYMSHP